MRLASLFLVYDLGLIGSTLILELNDLRHDKGTSPHENHIVG